MEAVAMSQAQGAALWRASLKGKARAALALVALGLMLGGCGNCGGWTNPWYNGHSCGSDHGSE
jgi:hypothetical protein